MEKVALFFYARKEYPFISMSKYLLITRGQQIVIRRFLWTANRTRK